MYWLLLYDVVDDFVERRGEFRAEHLELARASAERGELLFGGALADPADGAVLLFRGDTAAGAETFARADPYVVSGLVTDWRVRGWSVVAGALHSTSD